MNETLQALIDGYLNGTLDESEFVKLEAMLQGDPVAKRSFTIHLVLHGQLGLIAEELRGSDEHVDCPDIKRLLRNQPSAWRVAVLTATAASLLMAVVWFAIRKRDPVDGRDLAYDMQPIPIRTVGFVDRDGDHTQNFPVMAGSDASVFGPSISGSTEVTTAKGASVRIASDTLYGFSTETLGLLFRGEALVSSMGSTSEYAIELGDVRTVAKDATFRVARTKDGFAVVEAIQGVVEIQKRVGVPRMHWSFDDGEASHAMPLTLGTQVARTNGLVGQGALRFTDERGSCVWVEGGTEATVGSGMFAMSGGMTIEAIILSTWNGAELNQDTIFRKEDGPNRILFSFQNNVRDYEVPDVPPGPVLSFGIFLRGLGYSELDMPLDGKAGRPTVEEIADGRPHHIAATYDSFSGLKAIAVDGRICFSHQFPIGHCIQSGGPKPAMIGGWRNRETFAGVIDELAIYDYALSAEQIARHSQLAQKQETWFLKRSPQNDDWTTTNTIQRGETVEISSTDEFTPQVTF